MAIEDEAAHDVNRRAADKQAVQDDGTPKFGRLLLVLAASILIVVALTFGSLAYYT